MLAFIYNTLSALGYHEPIHPVSTHIPMGMGLGGLLFKLASYKWKELEKTSYYCLVLALIMAPLRAVAGIMDWQYRLAGVMTGYIMAKLVLAVTLVVLLLFYVILHRRENVNAKIMTLLYIICFLNIVALGFIGGHLVFE
jgi:uncharacterized membrane protein